jgi:hypothetical protein
MTFRIINEKLTFNNFNNKNKIYYDDEINGVLKNMSMKYNNINEKIIINDEDMLNFITSNKNIAMSKYYGKVQILYFDIINMKMHIISPYYVNIFLPNKFLFNINYHMLHTNKYDYFNIVILLCEILKIIKKCNNIGYKECNEILKYFN